LQVAEDGVVHGELPVQNFLEVLPDVS
jgi:hypothetical protein